MVRIAHHVHVNTGGHRFLRGPRLVPHDSVPDQFPDGSPIAHHQAGEPPLIAQNPGQSEGIRGSRQPVDRVERTHQRSAALAKSRVERGKIDFPERVFGDLRCIVVAPAFRRPVPDEMLDAGRDALFIAQVFALIPANVGARHHAAEVRIFAGSFHDAAPTRVSRDVHHRRKCPANTRRRRFLGRNTRVLFHDGWVPGGGQCQGHGEGRPKSVNHIQPKKQRNVQPGFFHRDMLILVRGMRAIQIEKRTDFSPGNHARIIRGSGTRASGCAG